MDHQSKVFFAVFLTILMLSVLTTYYKYMVIEEYEVFIEYDDAGMPMIVEE